MEPHEKIYKSRTRIFVDNFIGGIAWALGATIGISLIIALLGYLLKNINLVPIVGSFISDVIKFAIEKNPNLLIK